MKTLSSRILRILTVAMLATLVALPAVAEDALAICQSGQPYRWPNGGANIPWNPDQGGLGSLTNAQGVATVQQAFDNWENLACASATFVNAGPLPVDVDITNFGPFLNPLAPDGLSAIVFDDTGEIFALLFGAGSGILGFAGPEWLNPATCEILEGVSFLNGPAFGDPTEAEDVNTHEFGHYSNLGHVELNGQLVVFGEGGDDTGPSPDNTTFGPPPPIDGTEVIETMYPIYFGPTVGTRTPHADDIGMFTLLYPDPSCSETSISGTIFASNGVTRLSGVNVIARNVANPFVDSVSTFSGAFTDSISQVDPNVGTYILNGLTPGATYLVFVDRVTAAAGRFSNPILTSLPGPEEFHNGANESGDPIVDDPTASVGIVAGGTQSGIDVIFNGTAPGEIDLGDDDTEELSLPFPFTICGETFESVFVNSNGSLTFGEGDTDFSESTTEFLAGPPRAAPLWDDLAPNNGGTVSFTQDQNNFTVRFENVPEFPANGANTFEITLTRASDHVEIDYGSISASDGLAGVTCGCLATSGSEQEVDVRTQPNLTANNLNNETAVFELFTGDNDLADFSLKFVNLDKPFNDDFEPNDSLGAATEITAPFNSADVFTSISPIGGDVDYFKVTAEEGQTLIAEIQTGCLDSVLGIFDNGGNLVDFDDDGGAGLLSRILFEVPADGMYFIAVSAFPDTDFDGDGGSGGRYTLDVILIDGVLLDLGDDDFELVDLGFTFPFQGATYTSAFVGSNGFVTFGSGDTDFSESVGEFLNDQPRIAGLWDDLSPNNGGQVILTRGTGSATVSFLGVPEFVATGSNTFAITMNDDGSVVIAYGAVSAADGIVGVTPGGGAINPGETDLSAAMSLSVNGVTFEQFTFGDAFDLSGVTLVFSP